MRKFFDLLLAYIQLFVLIVLWLLFYLFDFINMFFDRITYLIKIVADSIKADILETQEKYED